MGEPAQALKDSDKKNLRDLTHRQSALRSEPKNCMKSWNRCSSSFRLSIRKSSRASAKPAILWATPKIVSASSIRGAVPPERDALERLSQSQQIDAIRDAATGAARATRQYADNPAFPAGPVPPFRNAGPASGHAAISGVHVQGGFTGLDTEKFRLPGKKITKRRVISARDPGVPQTRGPAADERAD